jgi:hypothetical protein
MLTSLTDPKVLYAAVPLFWYFEWFKFVFIDSMVLIGIILCSPILWFGIDKLSQRYPLVEQSIFLASSHGKVERDKCDRVLISEEGILPFNLFVWNLVLCILWYAFRYNPD